MNLSKYLKILIQTPSPPLSDPLVSQGGEHTIYIGIFLLIVTVVLAIGFFSQKIEYAIGFALLLSLVLIILLLVA